MCQCTSNDYPHIKKTQLVAGEVTESHHPIPNQVTFLTAVLHVVKGTLLTLKPVTPGHTTCVEIYIWSIHTFSHGNHFNPLHTWLQGWSPGPHFTKLIGKIFFHIQPLRNPSSTYYSAWGTIGDLVCLLSFAIPHLPYHLLGSEQTSQLSPSTPSHFLPLKPVEFSPIVGALK